MQRLSDQELRWQIFLKGAGRIAVGVLPRVVRFLELLDAGMRPLEASREVGVNPRTGADWANGIVKSKNRRYTFDGVLVWEAP